MGVAVKLDLITVDIAGPFDVKPIADFESAALSFVALTILQKAPGKFRRGKPYSVRDLALQINYSASQTHTGLKELYDKEYVTAIPYGGNGRKTYRGNPAKLLNFPQTDRQRTA